MGANDPRFHPKDDVSGSTSLKSSVQRGIRSSLLAQYPFLSQPATREAQTTSEEAVPEAVEPVEEEEEDSGKGGKKKGGKKGGGGKGGGKSKGKGKDKGGEVAEVEEEEGEVNVLDEIWPKKEALGLTKW